MNKDTFSGFQPAVNPAFFPAALATAMFPWFLSEPMPEKLDRVKVKYGLTGN